MFKLFKSKKNGQWYWSLVAKNSTVICQSEGYKTLVAAHKGLRSVIKNASGIINPSVMVKGKEKDKYTIR